MVGVRSIGGGSRIDDGCRRLRLCFSAVAGVALRIGHHGERPLAGLRSVPGPDTYKRLPLDLCLCFDAGLRGQGAQAPS